MKRHRTCNPLKNKQAANRGGRLAAVILLSRHIDYLKPFMGIACEFGAWWRRPAHFFLDCRAYASENLSPMPQKDFAKTEMARGLNINIPLPTLSVPPAFGGKPREPSDQTASPRRAKASSVLFRRSKASV